LSTVAWQPRVVSYSVFTIGKSKELIVTALPTKRSGIFAFKESFQEGREEAEARFLQRKTGAKALSRHHLSACWVSKQAGGE
jgi:hypothetical protein